MTETAAAPMHAIDSLAEMGPMIVHLTVADAEAAIAFYLDAFGGSELYRNHEAGGGGRIVHSELLIAGARLTLNDEFPEHDIVAPTTLGGTPVTLSLFVADVDAAFARAIAAGGVMISPLGDRFWGARSGSLRDPFGHRWVIATQVRDPAPDEIIRMSQQAPSRLGAAAGIPPLG
jgi:PhnB protein